MCAFICQHKQDLKAYDIEIGFWELHGLLITAEAAAAVVLRPNPRRFAFVWPFSIKQSDLKGGWGCAKLFFSKSPKRARASHLHINGADSQDAKIMCGVQVKGVSPRDSKEAVCNNIVEWLTLPRIPEVATINTREKSFEKQGQDSASQSWQKMRAFIKVFYIRKVLLRPLWILYSRKVKVEKRWKVNRKCDATFFWLVFLFDKSWLLGLLFSAIFYRQNFSAARRLRPSWLNARSSFYKHKLSKSVYPST